MPTRRCARPDGALLRSGRWSRQRPRRQAAAAVRPQPSRSTVGVLCCALLGVDERRALHLLEVPCGGRRSGPSCPPRRRGRRRGATPRAVVALGVEDVFAVVGRRRGVRPPRRRVDLRVVDPQSRLLPGGPVRNVGRHVGQIPAARREQLPTGRETGSPGEPAETRSAPDIRRSRSARGRPLDSREHRRVSQSARCQRPCGWAAMSMRP